MAASAAPSGLLSTGQPDSEEDLEPKLKYSRLTNDLTKILAKEPASCLSVGVKFLALGTHYGAVHILDLEGNEIPNKKISISETSINQISMDAAGEYIACCSDDGKAAIVGIWDSKEHDQLLTFDRPIKAIAIEPDFSARHSSRRGFITGDEKLVLNERGMFGRNAKSTLHQGEGLIRNIKWRGQFVAWANDEGVKVYDMQLKERITFIAKDLDPHVRPELYRCNLCWRDGRTLLIGWGDRIKVCTVKDREVYDRRDLPPKYVEISRMFQTDYFISGIAPYGENIVVLTYDESSVKREGKKMEAPRPHLRILEPGMGDAKEISNDAIAIKDFQSCRCSDYHLEYIGEEGIFFIVSPHELVIARPRTVDDHVSWLLDRHRYEAALASVRTNVGRLVRHSPDSVGRLYVRHLFDLGRYDEAASVCSSVLGRGSRDKWEEYFYMFQPIGQIKALAPYLPVDDPHLSPIVYELVLNEFLQTDIVGFCRLIQQWPSELYDIQTVANAVLDRLTTDTKIAPSHSRQLYESLAELYTRQRSYEDALTIYLRLKHDAAFDFMRAHNLIGTVGDRVILLMDFNCEKAVQLLVDNISRIPPAKVMQQLDKAPHYQLQYLDKVFAKDSGMCKEYQNKMVSLYAEFDRPQLLRFLKRSDYYNQKEAIAICEARQLIPEKVFLLGKMGNGREALQLIITELKNVDYAIEFCKEKNDQILWDELITYSVDKPSFLKGLLDNIGTHVDPIRVIQRIKHGLQVKGLRDSLVKILHDYSLQVSLRTDCLKILRTDILKLLLKQNKTQKQGILVEAERVCELCREKIIPRDYQMASDVTAFFCHHAFHTDCLPRGDTSQCTLCNPV